MIIQKGISDAFMTYIVSNSKSLSSTDTSAKNRIYFESFKHKELDKAFLKVFLQDENINCWYDVLRKDNINNNVINLLR